MQNSLLVVLSIVGLFALYWVLFGQWKYNKKMREAEQEPPQTQEENKII